MPILNNIPAQEQVNFAKGLSLMLKNGIPIDNCLKLLKNQSGSKKLKDVLTKAEKYIEEGSPLYKAFEEEQIFFGNIFVNFIKTGEEKGGLEDNLQFLSEWIKHSDSLKKEIKSAMLYPKIIIFTSLIMGGGISYFILPQLVGMFEQMDITLPLTTRILLAFSHLAQDYTIFFVLGIVLIIVGYKVLLKIHKVKKFIDSIALRAPLFGPLMADYQLAFFSQVFSILLENGVPIKEAIEISGPTMTNAVYQDSMIIIEEKLNKGVPLSEAMKEFPKCYPILFTSIIFTGEETGSLEESSKYLAQFYTANVKTKTQDLPTMIEPMLLIFIGIGVAILASAIIMPIYEITQGLEM